jgi:hypothetical protein
MSVYPSATPELRILKLSNGQHVLQVRYVNITQGYTSKWQDVPVVEEERTV